MKRTREEEAEEEAPDASRAKPSAAAAASAEAEGEMARLRAELEAMRTRCTHLTERVHELESAQQETASAAAVAATASTSEGGPGHTPPPPPPAPVEVLDSSDSNHSADESDEEEVGPLFGMYGGYDDYSDSSDSSGGMEGGDDSLRHALYLISQATGIELDHLGGRSGGGGGGSSLMKRLPNDTKVLRIDGFAVPLLRLDAEQKKVGALGCGPCDELAMGQVAKPPITANFRGQLDDLIMELREKGFSTYGSAMAMGARALLTSLVWRAVYGVEELLRTQSLSKARAFAEEVVEVFVNKIRASGYMFNLSRIMETVGPVLVMLIGELICAATFHEKGKSELAGTNALYNNAKMHLSSVSPYYGAAERLAVFDKLRGKKWDPAIIAAIKGPLKHGDTLPDEEEAVVDARMRFLFSQRMDAELLCYANALDLQSGCAVVAAAKLRTGKAEEAITEVLRLDSYGVELFAQLLIHMSLEETEKAALSIPAVMASAAHIAAQSTDEGEQIVRFFQWLGLYIAERSKGSRRTQEGSLMAQSAAVLAQYLVSAEPQHIFELLESISSAEEAVFAASRELAVGLAASKLTRSRLLFVAMSMRGTHSKDALRYGAAACNKKEGQVSDEATDISFFEAALCIASDIDADAVHTLVRGHVQANPPSQMFLSLARAVKDLDKSFRTDALLLADHSLPPSHNPYMNSSSTDSVELLLKFASDVAMDDKNPPDAATLDLVRRASSRLAKMLPRAKLLEFVRDPPMKSPVVLIEFGLAALEPQPPQASELRRRWSADLEIPSMPDLELSKWIVSQALAESDPTDALERCVPLICGMLTKAEDVRDFARFLAALSPRVSAVLPTMAAARCSKLLTGNTVKQLEIIDWTISQVIRQAPAAEIAPSVGALLKGVTEPSIALVLGRSLHQSAGPAALECALHALRMKPQTSETYDLALKLSVSDGKLTSSAAERLIINSSREEDLAKLRALLTAPPSAAGAGIISEMQPALASLHIDTQLFLITEPPSVQRAEELAQQAISSGFVDGVVSTIISALPEIASLGTAEGREALRAFTGTLQTRGFVSPAYRLASRLPTSDDAATSLLVEAAWNHGGGAEVERLIHERLGEAARSLISAARTPFPYYGGSYYRNREQEQQRLDKLPLGPETVSLACAAVRALATHGERSRGQSLAVWSLSALKSSSITAAALISAAIENGAAMLEEDSSDSQSESTLIGPRYLDRVLSQIRRFIIRPPEFFAAGVACEKAGDLENAFSFATQSLNEERDQQKLMEICELFVRCKKTSGIAGFLCGVSRCAYGSIKLELVLKKVVELFSKMRTEDDNFEVFREQVASSLLSLVHRALDVEDPVAMALEIFKVLQSDHAFDQLVHSMPRNKFSRAISFVRQIPLVDESERSGKAIGMFHSFASSHSGSPYEDPENVTTEMKELCKALPVGRVVEVIAAFEEMSHDWGSHDSIMLQLGKLLLELLNDGKLNKEHVFDVVVNKFTWGSDSKTRAACAQWMVELASVFSRPEVARQGSLKLFDADPSLSTYTELVRQWPELGPVLLEVKMPLAVRVQILCSTDKEEGPRKAIESIATAIQGIDKENLTSQHAAPQINQVAEGLLLVFQQLGSPEAPSASSSSSTAAAAATATAEPPPKKAKKKGKARSKRQKRDDDFEYSEDEEDMDWTPSEPVLPEDLRAAFVKHLEVVVWRRWDPSTSTPEDTKADQIAGRLLAACGKDGVKLLQAHRMFAPLRAMQGFAASKPKYARLVELLGPAWVVACREGRAEEFEQQLQVLRSNQHGRKVLIKMIDEWFTVEKAKHQQERVKERLFALQGLKL